MKATVRVHRLPAHMISELDRRGFVHVGARSRNEPANNWIWIAPQAWQWKYGLTSKECVVEIYILSEYQYFLYIFREALIYTIAAKQVRHETLTEQEKIQIGRNNCGSFPGFHQWVRSDVEKSYRAAREARAAAVEANFAPPPPVNRFLYEPTGQLMPRIALEW